VKYYAVTDDPNELMHYGVKGMKWGVIRTDAQLGHPNKPSKPRSTKPKSPAYMRAASKLSSAMKHGIAKAQANWKEYNSPANQKARERKRNERLFEKHMQLARQGRLKYKGISDKEVQRITDRLALENRARQQSGNEKQSFRRRINASIGEGIIRGVGQGTSSYIQNRMAARGTTAGKIDDEKRMAAYRNSLQGRVASWRDHRADKRDAKAQQKRENMKNRIRDRYNAEAERENNEDRYEALVLENNQMGYDRIYGDRGKFRYKIGRTTKHLSDADLNARISALEATKKLYGTAQDSRMKSQTGTVTETYKDEDGHEVKRQYSNGKVTDLLAPVYGEPRSRRSINKAANRGVRAERRNEKQYRAEIKRVARDARAERRNAERDARDAEKAARRAAEYELRKDMQQLRQEARIERQRAEYEARAEKQQQKLEERARKEAIRKAAEEARAEYRRRIGSGSDTERRKRHTGKRK